MADNDLAELERALDALGAEPTRERVDALNALAWEVGFTDIDKSAELAEEAVATGRELGDQHGIAWGLLNAAYRDYYVARYDLAMNKGLESLELFEALVPCISDS